MIEPWRGDLAALQPGRAVLLGFPQDEGVRRNHGRVGAAQAPDEIRRWLRRLTTWDPEADVDLRPRPPLDLGNLHVSANLEVTQVTLGKVLAILLQHGVIPVVLGGGHETALGHYLGYVGAELPVGIINIDAHLDVRPWQPGQGHSGSPFRQMLKHPTAPLPGSRYVCLGAQPHATSRQHWRYAQLQGAVIRWRAELQPSLLYHFAQERDRLAADGCRIYLTIDADAVQAADVPGVSAPNAAGLSGVEVIAAARLAGLSPQVASMDLVEINPLFDRDGQSARWAALTVWNFLIGTVTRSAS